MRWFIETPRLRLRRYERTDLDFFAALVGDSDSMRYIGAGVPVARAAAAQRLEARLDDAPGRGWFVALLKADGRPVGHIALVTQTVGGQDEDEIGWCLARDARGRGYATEGAAAMRDVAFAGGLKRIIHLIQPGNAASIAVAQRIGSHFERDTVFRDIPVRVYAQTRSAAAAV